MSEEQQLQVNGSARSVSGCPGRSLLGVLRDELNLTGAKYGCGEAQCGACVVLLDGRPVPSCITSVGSVGAAAVLTIEGLERDGTLRPVQEAFLEADALQCGYCTPGMILAVVALLEQNADPSEGEVIQALQKHVCRCGVYRRILKAVRLAAAKQAGAPEAIRARTAGDDR
ncbi:MAG: (2Fe-2S)-binding protein [Armatimonadetes bacterium]|nr:(2Fe-2S)-binding protein [Armatimonadota bacterium]